MVNKMEDIKKIDNFLTLIATAAKNGEKINPNTVYSNLIFCGINKKEENISYNFKIWENYYEGKKIFFVLILLLKSIFAIL